MDDRSDFRHHLLGGGRDEPPAWRLPLVLSVLCHFFLFVALVFAPVPKSRQSFSPSVINVDLVSVAEPQGAGGAAATAPERDAAPAPKAPEPVKSAPPKTISAKVAPKPEIQVPEPEAPAPAPPVTATVAPEPPRPKASLKQQTFQSEKVLDSALAKIEKTVETTRPDPLAAAFERLRQQVDKSPAKGDGQKAGGAGGPTSNQGQSGQPGGGGKEVSDLKDIYLVEIAYRVQKNWAFSEQLAGSNKNIRASLVFKVMPNGEIRDIFFTDRSGNAYLDESAYKAIVKSNPVDPHPAGLRSAFVEVGLRFGPEGLR
jgi:colicin import membrane protein